MFQLIDTRNGLLSDLLTRVTDIGRSLDSVIKQREKPLLEQCEGLLDKNGEAASLAKAQQLLKHYDELNDEEKGVFFLEILANFGTDNAALEKAINNWKSDSSEANARVLHFASEPRSQILLRRINQAPNGTLALVKMRADLLRFTRTHPELKILDQDFAHLFLSWFNRGFLKLQTMDWGTPANILEKVIAYEAVHEISNWSALRQRVADPDRRLYSYFHPALGIEPLIFVQVALTDHVPGAIAPILEKQREPLDPEKATTAVFYSISNCQTGLKGISFGNFLIKQVVENLREEFPKLETFITLSPVPGLRRWALQQLEKPDAVTTAEHLELIRDLERARLEGTLTSLLENNKAFKNLVATYLVSARSPRGGATDPVSRFHLGNGARLEDIHLQGDVSENGLNNSWGCMVNYQYRISDIEKNHETYVNADKIITSSAVKSLLK
ncbi:MCD, Malonyl-CoA decarboxylase MCD [Leucothrix arctica]|uniref:MCD, Malonyl-CoA decarboxylase MCD n=2 Tax=Leucothrix arctica TaxID=1481894 RepID=A0A317C907_9GAMM|nr:MCD, Malonyl-CoA decarboxylase MCD [Leucothrix arctica]